MEISASWCIERLCAPAVRGSFRSMFAEVPASVRERLLSLVRYVWNCSMLPAFTIWLSSPKMPIVLASFLSHMARYFAENGRPVHCTRLSVFANIISHFVTFVTAQIHRIIAMKNRGFLLSYTEIIGIALIWWSLFIKTIISCNFFIIFARIFKKFFW